MTPHDLRYDIADEFMEVIYKLLEGCWEDDAMQTDKASGLFADPSKVHRVVHQSVRCQRGFRQEPMIAL